MNARAAQSASNNPEAGSGHSPAQPPSWEELRRKIERRQREVEKLREQVAERNRRIAELERHLAMRKRNPANSSKPPPSDGLAGKRRNRCSGRKKSERKPGGQPGYIGYERPPVENPDRIEEDVPATMQAASNARLIDCRLQIRQAAVRIPKPVQLHIHPVHQR